jgi:hypothetical protein
MVLDTSKTFGWKVTDQDRGVLSWFLRHEDYVVCLHLC